MALVSVASLFFPHPPSHLSETHEHRLIYSGFFINLPIGGVVFLALIFIHIPDRRPKSEIKTGLPAILHSFDLPGFAIFASAAIMFLLAIEWGGTTYRWGSATVIGLFCGAAGALVVFLLWEHRRGDTAMLPLSMLSQRIVWSSCLTYFFICSNLLVTSFYMAIYFQAVRGTSPTMSGVYLLPSILSQMLFAMFSGVQGLFSDKSTILTGADKTQLVVLDITSHGLSLAVC